MSWCDYVLVKSYTPFADPKSHIDNEYSQAGVRDPKIIITTSRDPSSKLLQFAKVSTTERCLSDETYNLTGNAPCLPQFESN